ncbi:hypothetical protein [Streptomyces sp. NPDC003077]|uniref:hypothetical protein n=1 Tax=Streptomyces sp. NPDC003077 TaxID=3154443 RepID=UPI0033A29A6E
MSANCNKAFQLSLESLRDKKRLSRNAGLALLGAGSDLYKALELAERGDGAAAARVYVVSAQAKLGGARGLLEDVLAILATGTLRAGLPAWYRNLDYDRLYRTGVEQGALPHGSEVWQEITGVLAQSGPLALTEEFRARVAYTADLASEWLGTASDAGSAPGLLRLVTAVSDLTAFARYVGYVNDVEPLDAHWLRPAPAGDAA